jgi:hypothetical protein
MIAEPVIAAYETRIKQLEADLEESQRALCRTENARLVLLEYWERHRKRIFELEDQLHARG